MHRSIALLMIASLLSACQPTEPQVTKRAPPTVSVLVSNAEKIDVPIYVESLGLTIPSQQVDVRPQVSGVIDAIHFVDGQHISKGAPVATIDSESYNIQLQEAQAMLLQRSNALANALNKQQRYSTLVDKQLISQQEWEEIKNQVAQYEAQVQADRAKVAAAALNVKKCTLVAPIAGQMGKVGFHPGSYISAGQSAPLVTVTATDLLYVEFTLTENEYRQLAPKQRQEKCAVEIETLSQPILRDQGVLCFVNSSFDHQTGLISLRARLDNHQGKFSPGQYVRVKVPVYVMQNVPAVPQRAVKINQQGSYLFVVNAESIAEMRPIKLGKEIDGETISVTSGVMPGEQVVVEGHLRLAPGMPVAIKEDLAP